MQKKITIKYLIRELLDILELKRGAPRTFLKILTKPIEVVDSYITLSHKENGFIGPFRLLFIISIFCVFVNESLKPNKDYEEIPLVQLGIENIHAGLEEFVYENHFDYWEFYWGGMNAFTDKMTIIADSVGIDSVSTMERDRQYDEAVDARAAYYEKNISEQARNELYRMLDLSDKIQLTINPIYYFLPIVIIISCITFLIFFHTKKSFIEHFIINFYPIGIIFLCYGLINITEWNYFWIDKWLRPIVAPETIDVVRMKSNAIKILLYEKSLIEIILFGLERFFIAYYYLNIFGKYKIKNLKVNNFTWRSLIISGCIVLYPTFDFCNMGYMGFFMKGGLTYPFTNSLLGFNLYDITIFNWKELIYYMNEIFYYKILYFFIT